MYRTKDIKRKIEANRHAIGVSCDIEVDERACRLCTIVAIGRHVNWPESVLLGSHLPGSLFMPAVHHAAFLQ